jgi:hypothetical protein
MPPCVCSRPQAAWQPDAGPSGLLHAAAAGGSGAGFGSNSCYGFSGAAAAAGGTGGNGPPAAPGWAVGEVEEYAGDFQLFADALRQQQQQTAEGGGDGGAGGGMAAAAAAAVAAVGSANVGPGCLVGGSASCGGSLLGVGLAGGGSSAAGRSLLDRGAPSSGYGGGPAGTNALLRQATATASGHLGASGPFGSDPEGFLASMRPDSPATAEGRMKKYRRSESSLVMATQNDQGRAARGGANWPSLHTSVDEEDLPEVM